MLWHKQRKWSYSLQNKIVIRKDLLKKREGVLASERQKAAVDAANLLIATPLFKASEHIACYFAQNKEFDCHHIIKAIWETNKNCYLPVLSSDINQSLEFVLYHENDPLALNRYKILEPQKAERFQPEQLDLVLMPLVGFDLTGNRLGMGGGYYDKTFYFKIEKNHKKPYLLGLAYEIQKFSNLPHDVWDVQLDGVLTEKDLYSFRLVAI